MRDDKRYLRWCLRQERGIRLTAPSDNLVKAYLEKSRNALRSMEVNAQADIEEWAVSASYYAKYFVVYALLSKIGVKCEIHDCTIALFGSLFSTVECHRLVRELKQSKDDRVDVQYYSKKLTVGLADLMQQTNQFVLQIEELIDGLNTEEVARLQKKLRELTRTSRRR
jgi:uncharacterized protein (UPF0332 family)